MHESTVTSPPAEPAPNLVMAESLIPIASLQDCGLGGLEIPGGWEIGRVESPTPLPILRMALFRTRGDGPWIACETLTAFHIIGDTQQEPAAQRCENTLRGLAAQSVMTTPLKIPVRQAGAGARSNGFFTLSGQRLWAQCSTYMQGPSPTQTGLLIEQILLVEALSRAWLRDDIGQLTDDVHAAVHNHFGSVASQRFPEEGNTHGS